MTKAMSQALSNPEIARVMRDAIGHAHGGTMTIAEETEVLIRELARLMPKNHCRASQPRW